MEQNLNSEKLQLIQEILAIESEEVLAEIRGIISSNQNGNYHFSQDNLNTFARRSEEMRSGKVKGVSWDEVQKSVGLK